MRAEADRLFGTAAASGVAIGEAHLLPRRVVVEPGVIHAHEVASEVDRLDRALARTDAQLEQLQRVLERTEAGEGAAVVEASRQIVQSAELAGEARRLIAEERLTAPWAVWTVTMPLREAFARSTDPLFRERSRDIEAVIDRLLRTLLGCDPPGDGAPAPGPGQIGIASALAPLDPFALKRGGILGLATEGGGLTSHATILVRALGIPYVLGVTGLAARVHEGDVLVVDGDAGEVLINPDENTLEMFRARQRQQTTHVEQMRALVGMPAVTRDGTAIALRANIEAVGDIAPALDLGAEGVGLLRTEFLYLERRNLPDEEEQLEDALAALKELGGRPVTFRTLDIGSDKELPGVNMHDEANPALGLRAIRLSLRHPSLFRAQLRALYRASAAGPLRIMFPMITSLTELLEARAVCRQVSDELARQGIPHDPHVPIGCMIETPSAALTTDHLATASDFFSLGTNDLTQFAFATDRNNEQLLHLYHPLHPAMLRLLGISIDAARRAGKPISMCGDMASDPALVWILLALGLRELSMSPRHLPAVKAVIRKTDLREAEALLARALKLSREGEIEELVLGTMQDRFPLELGSGRSSRAQLAKSSSKNRRIAAQDRRSARSS